MNVITKETELRILKLAVEGTSLSSIARITRAHRDTCSRFLVEFGQNCKAFLNREMKDLTLRHIEIDEIWTFCRKKDKNVTTEEPDYGEIGSIWIYVALDEDSRLVPTYRVGGRNAGTTYEFLTDLRACLQLPKAFDSDSHAYKPGKYEPVTRISSDGFKSYETLVDLVFGPLAEYAQVVKHYRKSWRKKPEEGQKVQPFITKKLINGKNIDMDEVSTSLVERNNLTIRTFMRRLMRRTLGFSKKLANLDAATAVHMAHYNYCWRHKSFKNTAAERAGIVGGRLTLPELYENVKEMGA